MFFGEMEDGMQSAPLGKLSFPSLWLCPPPCLPSLRFVIHERLFLLFLYLIPGFAEMDFTLPVSPSYPRLPLQHRCLLNTPPPQL